jgi:uncharacterized protein
MQPEMIIWGWLLCAWLLVPTMGISEPPTFDCNTKGLGSVEQQICADPELSALDHGLAAVFKKAQAIDKTAVRSTLSAEQRGWIKGRNDCWKERDVRACIVGTYLRRTSELEARYRLVSPGSTVIYLCESNPANELLVNYFNTGVRVAIVEHGDQTFTLFKEPGDNSNRYQGSNETLTVEDSGVRFIPAYEAAPIRCVPREDSKPRMHASWDLDNDGVNDCERDGSCDHTVDYSKERLDLDPMDDKRGPHAIN